MFFWPKSAEQYLNPILIAPIEWLRDESFVETLISNCGINAEYQLLESIGISDRAMPQYFDVDKGMRLWQYPKQFAKYLVWLSDKKIESYLEIGTRYGGTFLVTVAYLSRFNPIKAIAGVDLLVSEELSLFSQENIEFRYLVTSTESVEFAELIYSRQWDLVFVDGDHSNPILQNDLELAKKNSRFVALHDIVDMGCPHVMELWQSLKKQYQNVEFIEQYTEVFNRTGKNHLGIGIVDLNRGLKWMNPVV